MGASMASTQPRRGDFIDRASQQATRSLGDDVVTKGPQTAKDIFVGPTPPNAKRLIVIGKIYVGDVRETLNAGDFVDVVPGDHWRHEGKPFKEFRSLMVCFKHGFLEAYDPRNQEHQQILQEGSLREDGVPSASQMEAMFADAPTVAELEGAELDHQSQANMADNVDVATASRRDPNQGLSSRLMANSPDHQQQAKQADGVAVGMDAKGQVRRVQEYDPEQGDQRPDDGSGAMVTQRPLMARQLPPRAAQDSRPIMQGKNATARLAASLQKGPTHASQEERRTASEMQRMNATAADGSGGMLVQPGQISQVVSAIEDPPEPEGLKNLKTVGGGTQTVGYTATRKTEVIRNGVNSLPTVPKAFGRPIRPSPRRTGV